VRDFAHIRASLRTLNEADLFVVITLVTILAVGAIRRSMMDGVVSGIVVTVFGLIWLAFSRRKIMHGLFGIQTAIGISIGLLLLAGYFTPNLTGEWVADAASVLGGAYLLISLSAAFGGWLAKRHANQRDRVE
jgi:hypothetical protein